MADARRSLRPGRSRSPGRAGAALRPATGRPARGAQESFAAPRREGGARMKRRLLTAPRRGLSDEPLWYKDAVIYELRVRSYMDSNGDCFCNDPAPTEK